MSVFTPVTPEQLSVWLALYRLGTLVRMQGIAAGIENTNYFVTTSGGSYVLTLFEKLTPAELPFYLGLLAHLAQHGIPSPAPAIDHKGRMFSELNGKPAALMSRLQGGKRSPRPLRHTAAKSVPRSPRYISPVSPMRASSRIRAVRAGGARPRPK